LKRVGYNNWREIFNVDNETNEIDTATIEGNLLTAFIGNFISFWIELKPV